MLAKYATAKYLAPMPIPSAVQMSKGGTALGKVPCSQSVKYSMKIFGDKFDDNLSHFRRQISNLGVSVREGGFSS